METKEGIDLLKPLSIKSRRGDSNPRPVDYEDIGTFVAHNKNERKTTKMEDCISLNLSLDFP